jgi:hypothetical protein
LIAQPEDGRDARLLAGGREASLTPPVDASWKASESEIETTADPSSPPDPRRRRAS